MACKTKLYGFYCRFSLCYKHFMKIIIETTPKKGKKMKKDLEQLVDKHHVKIEYCYDLEEVKNLLIKFNEQNK